MASLEVVYEEVDTGDRMPCTLARTGSTNSIIMDTSLVKHLRIASETADIYENSFAEENSRIEALNMARKIVAKLETPEEVVLRYGWEIGSHRMALRVGIDLGLFRMLSEKFGEPVSAEQLADQSEAETPPRLHFSIFDSDKYATVRIMRVLSATGFVTELGVRLYTANMLTNAIATPALQAATKILHDNSALVEMRLHEYFRIHGYKCPTEETNCAFQWTFNTSLTYFQRIHSTPETLGDFNTFMAGYRNKRKHWIDWFPVETEVLSNFFRADSTANILIVDVGGGKGHDLERFLARFPQSAGHLVLQDVPKTISTLNGLTPGIKAMGHDFFTPQPIKGARIYYTHDVLHDWPDNKCREILRYLKSAMQPGYSKIYLNETILPDIGCSSYWAAGDINMMAILAAKKRTRLEWIELIESVGMNCVRIWKSPYLNDEEGIIEVMLQQE
ncbi:sterigmatocystin 8-O-methyltransferase protein [Rutstroemia sp. NJR-2017a WRK4]|nr:sterigmatocystin 8-O-methyltransferase protein [Rutstroemia sp. NJR-2017a WRK4]